MLAQADNLGYLKLNYNLKPHLFFACLSFGILYFFSFPTLWLYKQRIWITSSLSDKFLLCRNAELDHSAAPSQDFVCYFSFSVSHFRFVLRLQEMVCVTRCCFSMTLVQNHWNPWKVSFCQSCLFFFFFTTSVSLVFLSTDMQQWLRVPLSLFLSLELFLRCVYWV